MGRNKRRIVLHTKQRIAKISLAILLLLCGLWLLPLAGTLVRPYVVVPELVTSAANHTDENKELARQLAKWEIDAVSIDYLMEMRKQKKDAFVYPRLGIHAPLNMNGTDPTSVRDWKTIRHTLHQGVSGSFGKTSKNQSTLYLIGHSSDYNIFNQYASVFASLGQAETGDRAIVMRESNINLIQITDTKTIFPNEVNVFETFGEPLIAGRDQIILVTCWPVLTTRSRLLVRGVVELTVTIE